MAEAVRPTADGLELLAVLNGRSARAWQTLAMAAAEGPRPAGAAERLPWPFLLRCLDPDDRTTPVEARRAAYELRLAGLLPPFGPFHIFLEAPTGPDDPEFRLRHSWSLPPSEDLEPERLTGAWYRSRRRGAVLMTVGQWRLWNSQHEPVPIDRNSRLVWWSRLRPVAEEAGALLDPFLRDEAEVVALDAIRPTFVMEEDGGLRVDPEGDGLPRGLLSDLVGDDQMPLSAYAERLPDGKRRRVVLTERAERGLGRVLSNRRYSAREAAEVLERPEHYFDPQLFDLSEYSERVIGIGPRRYRANRVMVSKADSAPDSANWVAGAVEQVLIELVDDADPTAEPVRLDVTDEEARAEARLAVTEAVDGDRALAWIQGRPVRASGELLGMLEDLPESRPSTRDGQIRNDLSLQIKTNIGESEHDRASGVPSQVPESWQPSLPTSLTAGVELFPYQRHGYRWLTWRQEDPQTEVVGGLLADDMGLGKTLQVLTLLARRADAGTLRPSLIVAPVSLLNNWAREARRFISAAVPRIANLREFPRGSEGSLARFDLVLTSYETLAARDVELGRIPWHVVVCDEAQKIKNPSTRAAHAVKAMRANVRVAMTGTPVENSLDDLWSVVDYLGPGYLGSLQEFRQRYAGRSIDREQAAAALRTRLDPLVLRRLKEDLQGDLPALSDVEPHRVEMSPLQATLYRRLQHAAHQGDARSRLGAIQRLLQVCAHPSLLLPGDRASVDVVGVCPKLGALLAELDSVAGAGEKALVFARWVDLQWLLADAIHERYGVPVEVINGAVAPERRQGLIDRFSAAPGFGVLVLAPRACGVGLNITAANHVFHYTREWNPAVEAQATDRAHRIGQTRPVRVHTFEATLDGADTADASLARILSRKRRLIRDFVQPMVERNVGLKDFEADLEPLRATEARPTGLDILRGLDPARLLGALEHRPAEEIRAAGRTLPNGAGYLCEYEDSWAALVDESEAFTIAIPAVAHSGRLYLRTSAGWLRRYSLRRFGEVVPVAEVQRSAATHFAELVGVPVEESLD